MGVVSDEDFEKECKHIDIVRGRGNKKEVPEAIREIIAEEAINGTPVKDLSEEFNVSPSSISAYKNGATSTATYHEPNEKLSKKNDIVRDNIVSTARARLMQALTHITPEKMAEAKLRDIASVAKDMSAVINNTEPGGKSPFEGAQFIFHVPQARKQDDYEVIDVTN